MRRNFCGVFEPPYSLISSSRSASFSPAAGPRSQRRGRHVHDQLPDLLAGQVMLGRARDVAVVVDLFRALDQRVTHDIRRQHAQQPLHHVRDLVDRGDGAERELVKLLRAAGPILARQSRRLPHHRKIDPSAALVDVLHREILFPFARRQLQRAPEQVAQRRNIGAGVVEEMLPLLLMPPGIAIGRQEGRTT